MPPYTPYDPYDDMSDIESEYDSECEEIRLTAKEMCTPVKCKYCSNDFYDRCWDHSWDDEFNEELECDTIHAHKCSHNFKCAACHNQYVSQEKLNQHFCAKNYQCEVCLRRCKNICDVNSGNHGLRRSKRMVNCNEFYVRVTNKGLREIVRKGLQEQYANCSIETKEAKEKAEAKWFATPKELRRKWRSEESDEESDEESVDEDSSHEGVPDDLDVQNQGFNLTKQAENVAKKENEKKRKRDESEDESDNKQSSCSKKFRTWLEQNDIWVVPNGVVQNLVGPQ